MYGSQKGEFLARPCKLKGKSASFFFRKGYRFSIHVATRFLLAESIMVKLTAVVLMACSFFCKGLVGISCFVSMLCHCSHLDSRNLRGSLGEKGKNCFCLLIPFSIFTRASPFEKLFVSASST